MRKTTTDGLITVDVPDAPGWLVETVDGAVQGDTRTTMIKCKRAVPGEFFFMLAKDYTVAAAHVVPAERLLRELYPNSYARTFQEVKVDVVQTKTVGDREWWEAGYQLLHPRLGAIAKLERVTCVGEHVLLVSGEGAADDVKTHFAVMSRWMDTAIFSTMLHASRP